MRTTARIASFAMIVVLGVYQGGVFVQGAESYCPPGAKFCPAPGAPADVSDAGFGLGGYGAPGGFNDNAYFQSQLREGEQLIAVAPGGDFANVPASRPQPTAFPPATLYADAAPAPYSNGYAVPMQPVQQQMYATPADALGGFIPPPPGSRPAQPQPAPSTYADAGYAGYAAAPVPVSPMREPEALTAAAFQTPHEGVLASPEMFSAVRRRETYARNDEFAAAPRTGERSESYRRDAPESKKRRAEKLSEVANETSRRPDKIDLKPRPENRKPWWKSRIWPFGGNDDEPRAKKTRAEIKAERRETKLAAQRAKREAAERN